MKCDIQFFIQGPKCSGEYVQQAAAANCLSVTTSVSATVPSCSSEMNVTSSSSSQMRLQFDKSKGLSLKPPPAEHDEQVHRNISSRSVVNC